MSRGERPTPRDPMPVYGYPQGKRRDTMPSVPEAPGSVNGPSVPPQVDQAIGRAVRAILAKLWPALLAGALGTGGAIVARPDAPAFRVDAHAVRLAEVESTLKAEREERQERERQQQAINAALTCRLRVLASAAKRQGYDPGFAEDVYWHSQYLSEKPKTLPQWRSAENCQPLPVAR